MRRIAGIALLVVLIVALVVGWRIWTRPPAIVLSLRALPEVGKVEYTGPADAPLVVIHFLDWHFVTPAKNDAFSLFCELFSARFSSFPRDA